MPSDSESLIGTIVQDRYRIVGFIAEGAMGAVYRAQRVGLERTVALKFLNPAYAANPQASRRFEREAKAMSRLDHPNCVSVIDFGVSPAPFIVMEHVTGENLRETLDSGTVPVERAVYFVRGILAGLAHAHEHDIVHRDIKPANVMITHATGTDGLVRILDFGLAKLRDQTSSDVSDAWLVLGTPNYMSPEQGQGSDVDSRSDLYSTGVVLFELLTGKKPFTANDQIQVLLKHQIVDIPRLSDVAPEREFPSGMQAVIDRAMAKSPNDRFADAIEFRDALGTTQLNGTASTSVQPLPFAATEILKSTDSEPTTRLNTSPKRWPLAVGLAVLLAGTASAMTLYNSRSKDNTNSPDSLSDQKRTESTSDSAPDTIDSAPETLDSAPDTIDAASETLDSTPDTIDSAPDTIDTAPDTIDAAPDTIDAASKSLDTASTAVDVDEENDGDFTLEELKADAPNVDPPIVRTLPSTQVVRNISDALKLTQRGHRDAAIAGLRQLSRTHPKNANIPYHLGNLLFDKMRWSSALEQYQLAIRKAKRIRRKPTLIKNAIRAMGSTKTRRKAQSVLRYRIGTPALTYLRRAAKRDKSPMIRNAANQLLKRMSTKKTKRRRRPTPFR